uniref:Uncharacterized protein n=1 Tax=Arundo donax TaxID=35708 RepID=A0A0A9BUE3_ARUDO
MQQDVFRRLEDHLPTATVICLIMFTECVCCL